MNKWISETTGLESKSQLKAHRIHKFNSLIKNVDLDMRFYPFFTQAEKDVETDIWNEADQDYEQRKVKLRAELNKLTAIERSKYFQEIEVTEKAVNDFLPVSPVII